MVNVGKQNKKFGGKITLKGVIKSVERGFNKEIAKPTEKLINKSGKDLNKAVSAVGEYASAVFGGRNDYPPKVRDILEKVGEKYITGITIGRTPVSGLLTGALSLFSMGKFGKRLEKNFDELFHLFVILTLEDGTKVSLEKNEVINMDINPSLKRPDQESKIVDNNKIPYLTINVMLFNTKKFMGNKYFNYDAANNNCQDYIVAFFKSNHIGDESDITFIKQNTKQLFNNLGALKNIAHATTDLGAAVNVITTGAGIEEVKNYGMMLNHLTKHITDPKESIDTTDFIQSKKLISAILKEKKHIKGGKIKENKYIVQSVVFDKSDFDVRKAKKWLKSNNYKYEKVDKEANTLRFRQEEPDELEEKGYTKYRTKVLSNNIKLILVYKNKKISDNYIKEMSGGKLKKHLIIHHYVHHMNNDSSDSDSNSDEEMEGGKLDITKEIKKVGKQVSKPVVNKINKTIEPINNIIPTANKASNKIGSYVTSKKGGLATDLIDYGIPAATGALVGAPLGLVGGPVAGVLGSAAGAKLGKEVIVPMVHKKSGAGFKKGSDEAHQHMAKIRALKKGNKKEESNDEPKEESNKGNRFQKGSQAAKDHMAKIRAMKKK